MEPASPTEVQVLKHRIGELEKQLAAVRTANNASEFYRLLLASAPVSVLIIRNGLVAYANRAALEVLKASQAEDVIGRSLAGFIAAEHSELFEGRIRNAIAQDELGPLLKARFRRLDESVVEVEAAIWRVPYDDGYGAVVSFLDTTERSRTERALRMREEQLRMVIDGLPGLVSYVDRNFRYLFVNRGYSDWFRRPEADFLNRTTAEVLGEDDFANVRGYMERALAGESIVFERRHAYNRNQYRDVRATYVPDRAEDGSVRGFFVFVQDVTERKAARRALEHSEQRYRALVEASAQYVWTFDSNGSSSEPDPDWWSKLTGQSRAESRNWGWLAMLHPDDRRRVRQEWTKALKCKGMLDTEYRVRNPDGEHRHFVVRGVPVWNEDGSFREWVGTLTDVTDRKRVEEALRASEERFRKIVETSAEGIWIIDPDSHTLFVNARMAEMLGYSEEELIGRSCFDFIHPGDVERGVEGLERRKNGDSRPREYRAIRRDGTIFWVSFTASTMRDDAGNIVGVLGMCTDISERKEADEILQQSNIALRRMNEKLKEFAFAASHDLKEPLRMVSIFSQLLGQRYRGRLDAEADKFLGFTEMGARRMQALVDDLLAFTQAGDTLDEAPEAVDCTVAAQTAIDNLRAMFDETRATITLDPLPVVQAHTAHLVQVFQNLIANALKYRSAEEPKIRIWAEARERDWLFSVSDNGIGIHPKFHEMIFKVFKRLHRNDQYSGTGIGLAICARVVERYGGTIWVDSDETNGSTFRFTLPRRSSRE
jgi:PAS domain S-box-containing protein